MPCPLSPYLFQITILSAIVYNQYTDTLQPAEVNPLSHARFSIRCILLLSFKPRLYLLLFLPRSFKICISRPPQMYYIQLFIQYEYSLPISRSGHLQASPFTIIYDIFALFAVIQYRAMCFIRTLLYRLYAHTSY